MSIFSKEKQEIIVILDIGSASVGGAIVSISNKKKPNILFTYRLPIDFQTTLESENLLVLMLKTLQKVTSKLLAATPARPERAVCFLSSPWYGAQTRSIRFRKEKPFIATQKLVNQLIDDELYNLYDELDVGAPTRIIEQNNIGVSLNGYKTDTPFGKKCCELEISLFLSMSPESVLKNIEHQIGNIFPGARISFSTLLFSSFIVARDLFMEENTFLLADIGGEVTDVSLVRDDILIESLSFPIGKNSLIRSLSIELGVERDEACSLFSLYMDKKLQESVEEKVGIILEEAKEVWLRAFERALITLSRGLSLPHNIFLTAGKDVSHWFIEVMKQEKTAQYSLTEQLFNVIILEARLLHSLCRYDTGIERDSFLSIESIYTDKVS